ncbi:37388_t:CDS:2 [Gigaspora margarita]|uniref:37388_t:CDS:1 n=1 Tax=Gigaspora margarita TaxID=4874 RepID=A0ABN7UMN7_GIGMA|nr:37388_t:CDS:2 [Gigaspora margarita]
MIFIIEQHITELEILPPEESKSKLESGEESESELESDKESKTMATEPVNSITVWP